MGLVCSCGISYISNLECVDTGGVPNNQQRQRHQQHYYQNIQANECRIPGVWQAGT